GAGKEIFAARRLGRAGEADLSYLDAVRYFRRLAGIPRVEREHHVAPHRRGARGARDRAHRIALEIADPHRDGEAVGEADAPIVAHSLRGAGLGGGPEGEAERAVGAE